ncbi:DegT/DnrJ/EryC1/StrS family aminotransferase [Pelagibacterales bacterium SAG-MED12]|nr:DegT/DnrJ/EryC1/StrS family aminotransferase [Pelagibacterales bacterium SAG-MED12]
MKVDFFRHSIPSNINIKLKKIIKGDIITSGPECKLVEKELSKYFNIKNVILTSSWTSGAIITLLSLNLKKNDEVIIPSMTFAATANVVEVLGAKPVIVDVDEKTFLLSFEEIKKKINKNTKVIFPVHLYGNMFDTKKLRSFIKKKKYKIHIIEDSAHAIESSLDGFKSGRWSKAAIFSFYATKNITCGEGGAVITNDNQLAEKIRRLKNFGLTQTALEKYKSKKYFEVDMKELGIKANLPDLLAFLILPQLKKINQNLKLRKKIFDRYIDLLKNKKIILPSITSKCNSSYHIFVVGVDYRKRDKIISYLKKKGIGCSVHYKPLHNMSYYKKKYRMKKNNFKISEYWGKSCITLPFHLKLTLTQQIYVVRNLEAAIKKY